MEAFERLLSYLEGLGISVGDRALLRQALAHRSYVNENPDKVQGSNERMEFLGDAVLGLLVTDHLYRTAPDGDEGDLSRRKALLVSEKSLSGYAAHLGIDQALLVGKGEHASGGRGKPSLLADTLEALVGALYLDGGLMVADRVIQDYLETERGYLRGDTPVDPKTRLQEFLQAEARGVADYRVVLETGPDHAKTFGVEVAVNGTPVGKGSGRRKKDAEQSAAQDALRRLRAD